MKKLLAVYASGLGENSMGKLAFEKVFELFNEKNPEQFKIEQFVLYNSNKTEFKKKVADSDLIIIVTSPYHFYLQSWMVEYLNDVSDCLKDKYVAGFISSAGLFEKICESQLVELMKAYGANYISGYSCIEYEIVKNDSVPVDFKKRTGNNAKDIIAWLEGLSKALNESDYIEEKSALIVTSLSAEDDYFKKCHNDILKIHKNVQIIDLATYKVVHCNACKACYTNKKCIFHDDFEEYETKLNLYTKVFFVIDLKNGVLNPLFTKFMQREVHNGLYPKQPDTLKEWSYLIKSNGYDTSQIKTYFDIFTSFGRVFSNVFVDGEVENLSIKNRVVSHQNGEETMPNMNCYTRFVSWHFKDLAMMLRNLLVPEYKFFKGMKYCNPPKTNYNVGAIFNIEDAKKSQKMRLKLLETETIKLRKK